MRSRRTWMPILLAVVAACSLPVWGCTTSHERAAAACSSDAECEPGTVCRVARCRKACVSNRWVGEAVRVKTKQGPREAVLSGCDGVVSSAPAASASATKPSDEASPPARFWVRYESGIEEQVEMRRVVPVHGAQVSVAH